MGHGWNFGIFGGLVILHFVNCQVKRDKDNPSRNIKKLKSPHLITLMAALVAVTNNICCHLFNLFIFE